MKKGYICICEKCGFKTNEKNKKCPICNSLMVESQESGNNLNPTLPEKIDVSKHENIKMGYYCFKCRKKMQTRVCIDCNNVGSLYLEYNNKTAIIKRISHLTDVFNDEEMSVILNELTEQEKVYIYHNYETAYRFFYKKDKNKAIACFIFALIFYFVLLDMTFNMNESSFIFMSYLFNAIGNGMFLILTILGIWYLFDATNVEFKRLPSKVGIIVGIPMIIQFAIALAQGLDIKWTLISGFISMGIAIIIYLLYFLWEKIHEK